MKTLNVSQMEIINGSFDCSNENRLAFVAGAAIGGAIFMGWGGLVTGYAAGVYTVIKCDN